MRVPLLIAVALMLAATAACRRDAPADGVATKTPAATTPETAAADASVTPGAMPAPAPATDAAATTADDHASVNATIDNLLGDHAKYEQAITAFQSAVAGKDPAAVAALVDYPFTARIDGKPVRVADAAAFVARYDEIVMPAIADAIAEQKYANLFVNGKGVMFGNGEAWINGICKDVACRDFDVRVVAIQPTRP